MPAFAGFRPHPPWPAAPAHGRFRTAAGWSLRGDCAIWRRIIGVSDMAASRDDLMAFLDELGIAASTAEHPPLFTVAESRELRGTLPGFHAKNLFLKDKKGTLFLVVAEEAAAVDLKRLHERIGASGRLSFGSAELLLDVLGVTPGSVTPFALLNDRPPRVQLVLDARLAAPTEANFHPLVNTATTTIASADLLRFVERTGHPPRFVDFSPPPDAADL